MNAVISQFTPASVASDHRTGRPDNHFSRLLKPLPGFALVNSLTQPAYREAGEFVASRFNRQYGASLENFMPWLMTMQCLGGLSGVVGLRPAGGSAESSPLFLEQYLDQPVEAAMNELGLAASRDSVVEIGNLVAHQRGASQLVFLLMTHTLLEAGYDWIVFTATRTLRNTLNRLDFPFYELGEASPQKLAVEERAAWGNYYDSSPLVVAARLDSVMNITERRPLLRQALRVYDAAIQHMAESLPGR